jgi:pimeloyl-ACP methyl ester carboxylesterase
MNTTTVVCTSCDRTLRPGGLFSGGLFGGDRIYTCESSSSPATTVGSTAVLAASCCPNVLCQTCFGQRPLFVPDNNAGSNDNDGMIDRQKNDLKAGQIRRLCRSCFESSSTLNFASKYDYQPSSTSSGTTFVFCHGASGCRQMFAPYAEHLKKTYGHGYLLIDLPGHGTNVETPLSPESTVQCTNEVLTACQLDSRDDNGKKMERLIYVGGSLGAYLGFYVLPELLLKQQQQNYRWVGAILMDCGQNVGPGRSMAARLGLIVLKWLATNSSNYNMMKMMLSICQKSPANYHLVECVFGAGMWFDQAAAHVECLRQIAPAKLLPRIHIPILYMNGSLDHRDSEDIWLKFSPSPQSSLKVYEGGDHFFTHDSRFVDDILARMAEFEKGPCQVVE